jgi:hypothetical protein
MKVSEFKNIVREIVRKRMRESVIDSQGLQRVGMGLPQTKEKKEKKVTESNGGGCGCGCGCGGK